MYEKDPIRSLLEEAHERGIGLAFLPDSEGWEIRHIGLNWPAVTDQYGEELTGRLAIGYDIDATVEAATRPMRELANQHDRYLASRERD